jgi:ABC-type multidrug transport system fused ATPase/permease subunit
LCLQDILDENLAESFHFSYIYGIVLAATVATVCIIFQYFILFAGALFLISVIALYTYLPASTQLKHLSAQSNGSLTGLISEALEGLEVIQAYDKQAYFIEESEKELDNYHRFFFNSGYSRIFILHCQKIIFYC